LSLVVAQAADLVVAERADCFLEPFLFLLPHTLLLLAAVVTLRVALMLQAITGLILQLLV
jgi:hypothetical protein